MYYFGPISSPTMFWIIVIIALVIAEIMTTALTTVWFVGGGIIAAIAAALEAPFGVQIVLFIVVSLAMLLAIRPIAVRYFNPDRVRTNIDAILGKHGTVTALIDNNAGTGTVKVDGMEWTARSFHSGQVIEPGRSVTVQVVDGVKLIVTEDNTIPAGVEDLQPGTPEQTYSPAMNRDTGNRI